MDAVNEEKQLDAINNFLYAWIINGHGNATCSIPGILQLIEVDP